MTHIYRWKKWLGPGQNPLYRRRCRVLARGRMNSALVQFEDGVKHVVSRFAIVLALLLAGCAHHAAAPVATPPSPRPTVGSGCLPRGGVAGLLVESRWDACLAPVDSGRKYGVYVREFPTMPPAAIILENLMPTTFEIIIDIELPPQPNIHLRPME